MWKTVKMDKVRRKVNQVFSKRQTDTTSSAGGFEDKTPIVVGVANVAPLHHSNQPVVVPPECPQLYENRHSAHYSHRREFFYQNQMVNNELSVRRRRRRHPRNRSNSGAE